MGYMFICRITVLSFVELMLVIVVGSRVSANAAGIARHRTDAANSCASFSQDTASGVVPGQLTFLCI